MSRYRCYFRYEGVYIIIIMGIDEYDENYKITNACNEYAKAHGMVYSYKERIED